MANKKISWIDRGVFESNKFANLWARRGFSLFIMYIVEVVRHTHKKKNINIISKWKFNWKRLRPLSDDIHPCAKMYMKTDLMYALYEGIYYENERRNEK